MWCLWHVKIKRGLRTTTARPRCQCCKTYNNY